MTHFKLPSGAALCGSELAEEFVSSPTPPACDKCIRIIKHVNSATPPHPMLASAHSAANVSLERVNASSK